MQVYLQWRALCLQADTEIGCFGWPDPDSGDPLRITRLWIPKQECTAGSVDREQEETARCIREGLAAGLTVGEATRVWLHTHPGDSAQPSGIDEKYWRTFTLGEHGGTRQHGHVMGIMAKGGQMYARLAIRTDEFDVDMDIDIKPTMDATLNEWAKGEIAKYVTRPTYIGFQSRSKPAHNWQSNDPHDWYDRTSYGRNTAKQDGALRLPADCIPTNVPIDSVYLTSGVFREHWRTPGGVYIKATVLPTASDLAKGVKIGVSEDNKLVPVTQSNTKLPAIKGMSRREMKKLEYKLRHAKQDMMPPLTPKEYERLQKLQEQSDYPEDARKMADADIREMMNLHERYMANLQGGAV
jgi:hypothetical protein